MRLRFSQQPAVLQQRLGALPGVTEIRAAGDAGVDLYASRGGVPTGLVSVPLRYMHSPVEMAAVEDIQAAARLIAAFARRLEPGISFER